MSVKQVDSGWDDRPELPLGWVRVTIGLSALGYAMVATLDWVTGVTTLSNRIQQSVVAVVAACAFLLSRRRPRGAGTVVVATIWLQLLLALAISSEPQPALIVFPVLAVACGLLLGGRVALWFGVLSSVATPLAYLLGKWRLTGSSTLSGHELTWLLVAAFCVLGAGLMTMTALRSYVRLLQASEAALRRYQHLFKESPDGLVVIDAGGRVTEANSAAVSLLGSTALEPGRLLAEALGTSGAATLAQLTGGADVSGLAVEVRRDGGAKHFELSVGAELGEQSNGRHLVVVRDVTMRRLVAERLGHAQRLETVGLLAGGIAHDFNNLLTAVGGNAALLEAHPDPEVRELASEIEEARKRGASLTRQLLAFARRDVQRREAIDLGEAVAEMTRLLERFLGEGHRLAVQAQRATVIADRAQVEQVVLNLVGNARDAMPRGGIVNVTIRALGVEEAARLGSTLQAQLQALLEVADTGVGMPADVLAHVFEPFFTTKPRGKGTGLGLATVHGIVAQNGGQILVESEVGRGSRFRVLLPCVSAEAASEASPLLPQEAPRGHERVLVVEDDVQVRSLVLRILTRAGYQVESFPDGASALASASGRGAPGLLLSDVLMPGLSGPEVAEALWKDFPGVPVLLTCGYGAYETGVPEGLEQKFEVLAKPFEPGELLHRVRRVIDDVG